MNATKQQIRQNPAEKANVLNFLFFGWTVPIFLKGNRRDLKMTDIYGPLKSDESKRLGDLLEQEWNKELMKAAQEIKLGKDGNKKTRTQPSLLRAICRFIWRPFMLQGLFMLVHVFSISVLAPMLQGWIINFFGPNQNSITRNQVLLYAGLLTIVTFNIATILHHTNLHCQKIGMCIRVACCSMLYRKVLRINQASNNLAIGHVSNLMSNDVARFDAVLDYLNYIWMMPVQVILTGYMMWKSVSVMALVGIGVMILLNIPIQVFSYIYGSKLRVEIAKKTDERVQLMNDLISGIEVVKLYSWEKPFQLIVTKVRALELKVIGYASYLRGFSLSLLVFSEKVSLYLILLALVFTGNHLNAEITFVLSNLINTLQFICAYGFPMGIILAGETAASIKRLTEFLLLDEIKLPEKFQSTSTNILPVMDTPTTDQYKQGIRIEMLNVTANWICGQLPPTLRDVSIKIQSQSLCALIGPVGSGKSSLLNLLLGEIPIGSGRLSFRNGENDNTVITRRDISISYTSQVPWLFAASVQDNILCGQPYDQERYQQVTGVCALLQDFEALPHGDLTFVGEKGASLSGGQKARINLARAIYRDAELYLLDDPLSAVDANVSRHLFEKCIKGFLKNKTRILVTHQLQYLPQADTVVILDSGTLKFQGTYEELSELNFSYLNSKESVDPNDLGCNQEISDHTVTEHNTITINGTEGNNSNEVIKTTNKETLNNTNEEEIAKGLMSNKVYLDYFLAGGNLFLVCFPMIAIIILEQLAVSGTDYWITYWTNQEALRVSLQVNHSAETNASYRNRNVTNRGGISSTEWQWFDEFELIRLKPAICVYAFCIFACIFLVMLRNTLFMKICMNASRNLHNSMFENLLQATMRFFNTNPSGRVLNRFSKDVGVMDEMLPLTMLETLHVVSVMIGVYAMVAVANNWMLIPMAIMIGLFVIIRKYYLRPGQGIKRLEGIAKSPVLSHVSNTLDGLTTIRSRGTVMEEILQSEFEHHQNVHSGAWYLSLATHSAFGFILDLIACAYIACVCFTLILMDDGHTLGSSVGLAISQSLILIGIAQHGIKQSAMVTEQMTAVERVLQYTDLPKEGPFTSENPTPASWPSKGGVVFKEVSMRYADNKPLALKGLNFNIEPGWKVGIVGRTGAGKSSLISALFRLTGDCLEGEITLDGVNTKSIGLHELRRHISIIPQEPILFSSTMRYNLDPFGQYLDSDLWHSIREVELGDKVSSLDLLVAEGAVNFSVGQRQLICLARTILRNNKLLILDEATANIDYCTDRLIQNTVKRKFAHCTVLTIAHRLNTIMDSDRVLVMGEGQVLEFGHPHLLLENPDGHFSKMLQQTGRTMAEELAAIAKNAFAQSSTFQEQTETTVIDDEITKL